MINELVILAAGNSKRMGDLGKKYSKPGVPVKNKPLLFHVIKPYLKLGITKIHLVLNPKNEWLASEIKTKISREVSIDHVIQKLQNGSGDAIRLALPLIKTDDIFLCACDNILTYNGLKKLAKKHLSKKPEATLSLIKDKKEKILEGSTVKLGNENRLLKIIEKPKQDEILSNYGVVMSHVINFNFLRSLSFNHTLREGIELDFMTELAKKIETSKIYGVKIRKRINITYPEDLKKIR